MKLRRVILAGELGRVFGREHHFAIATPGEAIRALCANFSDFGRHMAESEQRNVAYRVVVDKEAMPDISGLRMPFSETVRIVPVVTGAGGGRGLGGILLGAALIAGAFVFAPAVVGAAGPTLGMGSTAFSIGSFGFTYSQIAMWGVSLILSGVSSMLAPQQKSQGPIEQPENQPSYTFNGPVNTTSQGQPVPIGYGMLIVGSAVISAGITADEYTG